MIKNRNLTVLLFLCALSLSVSAELEKSDLDVKKISRTFAYALPVYHLNQLPLDTFISTNACDLFLESLDPSRSYFLQNDIDRFQAVSLELHKRLRKGDIEFAIEAYNTLMERMANRLEFTRLQLEKGFNTDVEETFQWNRKDASWPTDQIEWDELWRKRIKNEYIGRLVLSIGKDHDGTYSNTTEQVRSMPATNFSATQTASTVVETEDDKEAEEYRLSPEEFIINRYEQFFSTMDAFDEEMLLQRYLSAFSRVYDPHSDYLSPSSVEDFDINMKLSLVGIGAMLRPDDGAAEIVRLIPGGPAERDGRLETGDRITAVAQGKEEPVSIMHWPLYKTVRLIRGKKDTTVVLTVIPASDRSGTRTKKVDIVREEVKLEEQAAKSKIYDVESPDGGQKRLGVISLPDFYADFRASKKVSDDEARRASTDVRKLIDELQREGIAGLVLDLRNNGGGSLLEAIEIAGFFIPSGPVVQVKERRGLQVIPDADPEVNYEGPVIVLVNRLSASASEILAAALQDYKRAIIVGDQRTHGKGTVQTLMSLGNQKGSLKLTTAGFYRINGGSTQRRGVIPDIIIPSMLDVMDVGEYALEHALPWDTIHPAMFRTGKGFEDALPELVKRSHARRESHHEFQTFLSKRERLKELYETKTVSLMLSNRVVEAEAEREMDDIQNNPSLEDEEKNDLVLNEVLYILADLIDLRESRPARVADF